MGSYIEILVYFDTISQDWRVETNTPGDLPFTEATRRSKSKAVDIARAIGEDYKSQDPSNEVKVEVQTRGGQTDNRWWIE